MSMIRFFWQTGNFSFLINLWAEKSFHFSSEAVLKIQKQEQTVKKKTATKWLTQIHIIFASIKCLRCCKAMCSFFLILSWKLLSIWTLIETNILFVYINVVIKCWPQLKHFTDISFTWKWCLCKRCHQKFLYHSNDQIFHPMFIQSLVIFIHFRRFRRAKTKEYEFTNC